MHFLFQNVSMLVGLAEIPVPLGFEPRCLVQSVGTQNQIVDEYPGRN